jgi:predicted transcriptional regulator
MRDEILKFLAENGEKTIPQMSIKNISRSQLNNALVKMFQKGLVDRRLVMTPKSDMWAYTIIHKVDRPHQFKNEPDVVYFLRNLPREEFLEESIDLLEAAL